MKKLMFAMAAIAAGVAFADESIVSANIVGYVSKSLEANKWNLVGSSFEAVGTATCSIQNFVTGLTPGEDATDAPTIQYWDADAGSLKTLYYFDFVWSEEAEDFVVAWADDKQNYSDLTVGPGFSCWLMTKVDANATFAGQVVGSLEKDYTVVTGWQLIGNPYPTATKFNGGTMDCTNLPAGEDATDAPVIQYWDAKAESLKTLYYFDFVWSEEAQDFVVAWADDKQNYSDIELGACTGFWLNGKAAGTIKWTR